MDDWINKTWDIQTVECNSALKGKEIWTLASIYMSLEDIVSEISQSPKDTTVWVQFCEVQRQEMEWWSPAASRR